MERETRFELATPTLASSCRSLLLQCFLRLSRSCNCLELLGAAWGCSILVTTLVTTFTQLHLWCDASDRAYQTSRQAYPRTIRRQNLGRKGCRLLELSILRSLAANGIAPPGEWDSGLFSLLLCRVRGFQK